MENLERHHTTELQESDRATNGDPEKVKTIYEWYCSAMVRRDRHPITEEDFTEKYFGKEITRPRYAFGDDGRGYILGVQKKGVFIPRHFAPKTLRGGYSLLKELGESQTIPAVLIITEDLEATASKMPSWTSTDVRLTVPHEGKTLEKKVLYNSHPRAKEMLADII